MPMFDFHKPTCNAKGSLSAQPKVPNCHHVMRWLALCSSAERFPFQLASVEVYPGADYSVDKGVVWCLLSFTCDADEEPHDVAWDRYCDLQEELATVGLVMQDMDSDNDSVYGRIGEKTA